MRLFPLLQRDVTWACLFVAAGLANVGCRGTERQNGTAFAQENRTTARSTSIADSIDWKAVDQAMGRSGKMQPGDVYKYSMPRSDLRVSVGGVAIKPALALGSWVAFKRVGDQTIAMGDLVLAEGEIAPAMAKLQELGVTQSALHNHLLRESPAVMYMHIHGRGDPLKIAGAVRQALALTKTPAQSPKAAPAQSVALDTEALARVLGQAGTVSGGVYQVSVPRAEAIREDGTDVPPSMGVATAINFQPTEGGKAVITGDFVMTAGEVNPVLNALSTAGIRVTALHNHLLTEEPRLFFAHFWGNDNTQKLARGLRAALDKMNIKR